ncbi:MAG: hypothetical protein ACXWVS_06375 [Hyphomicrobium sp.]|jgi:nitrate reductase NapE component
MSGSGAGEDERRAIRFMVLKFVVFALLPVAAAAAIVYLTFPQ